MEIKIDALPVSVHMLVFLFQLITWKYVMVQY